MTLNELQAAVDLWIREDAGGYWDKFQILARLTEELGEVASALQRQEGLRPREVEVDIADEIGDVLFTVAAFANANGVDLQKSFDTVMNKYNKRDVSAWRENQSEK
jgi:NTP pyrophosphatase (non-canonical NTP hydrolase)